MAFNKNVFINCPFDEDYLPLLRPLLFTVIFLGFKPRISLENLDSGSPRIQKITRLIASSKYGIHDLSRLRASRAGEYYRLNMPFELGVDVGCRLFGTPLQKTKQCLVLEKERYRYQAAISDLSNSDIATHEGAPEIILTQVRNWLDTQAKLRAPGPAMVWVAFLDFMADNLRDLKQRGFSDRDIENLPISELMSCIERWVALNAPRAAANRRP